MSKHGIPHYTFDIEFEADHLIVLENGIVKGRGPHTGNFTSLVDRISVQVPDEDNLKAWLQKRYGGEGLRNFKIKNLELKTTIEDFQCEII